MSDLEINIRMGLNRHTRKIVGLIENAHWCKRDDLLFLLQESEKRRVKPKKETETQQTY